MNYFKINHTAFSEEALTIATTIPMDKVGDTLTKAVSQWTNQDKDYDNNDLVSVLMTEHPDESVKVINLQTISIYAI